VAVQVHRMPPLGVVPHVEHIRRAAVEREKRCVGRRTISCWCLSVPFLL
jgi:hypothetical protein